MNPSASPSSRAKLSSRKPAGAGPSRPAAPAAASPASTAPAPSAGKAASPTPAPAGSTAGNPAAAATPADDGKGLIGGAVDFIVGNAIVIVIVLAVAIIGVVFFSIRGGKAGGASELESEPKQAARPPVTRPAAAEEEGPRRVLVSPAAPGAPKPPAAAADREYALVVNEEDLKKPPFPEEAAGKHAVDSKPIQELLASDKYDDAYRQYVEKIESDGEASFSPEVERRLGDHFLRKGDLEKAGRVLEHHVATHPGDEIDTETYFNLGYIHFKGKTLNKSRRYFRLFVERHSEPAQVERARKLLARLERVHNLN